MGGLATASKKKMVHFDEQAQKVYKKAKDNKILVCMGSERFQ